MAAKRFGAWLWAAMEMPPHFPRLHPKECNPSLRTPSNYDSMNFHYEELEYRTMPPTVFPVAWAGLAGSASAATGTLQALRAASLKGRIYGYAIAPFLLAYISSIQIPGLRWSPITLLVGLILFLAIHDWIPNHSRLVAADRRALMVFFILIAFDAGTQYWFEGTTPAVVISSGAICCYLLITYQGAAGFEKTARVFFALLGVSMTVFLLGLVSPAFAAALDRFLPALDRFEQARFRGLARAEHILAYHLAFFSIWSFVKFLSMRGFGKKFPFAACCAISSLALIIHGSRMGLLSITFIMMIVIGVVRGLRPSKGALMAAVILILCSAWAFTSVFQMFNRNQHAQERGTVLERMQTTDDSDFRLELQRQSLLIIFQHPFGLRASGTDWDREVRPRMREYFVGAGDALSVHNEFLYAIMNNGWIFGGMVVFLVAYALGISMRMLRRASLAVAGSEWDVILPACFIADCMNACVHHAGFLNEPVSAIVLLLLLARHSLMLREAFTNGGSCLRSSIDGRLQDVHWVRR